ncbi:hypothetical protein [Streptomyces mayteni]
MSPVSWTTPPRPVNVTEVVPELAAWARSTTRLHPRPGNPGVHESSVGGPLLWPAHEPWPVCSEAHLERSLTTLDDVRELRRILAEAWARPREPRVNLLTPEEKEQVDRIHAGLPGECLPPEPVPLLPVAQLRAADVPDLPCPPGKDLLQVLWCPFMHGDDCLPGVRLRWRRAAEVVTPLVEVPEPDVIGMGDFVPEPCVLRPERATEYAAADVLPGELAARVHAEWPPDAEVSYQGALSVAPGWKVGGWPAPWTFCELDAPLTCERCGTLVEPLLTVGGTEWDGGSGSWRPLECLAGADREAPYPERNEPTMVDIGRSYTMQIYRCPADADHPPVSAMQ